MCDEEYFDDFNNFSQHVETKGYNLREILDFFHAVKTFDSDIVPHLEEKGKITALCDCFGCCASRIRKDLLEDEKLCNFLGLCDKIYDINRDVGEYAWITSKKPGESTNLTDFFPEWTDVDVSFDRGGHSQKEMLNKKRAEYRKSVGLPAEDEDGE